MFGFDETEFKELMKGYSTELPSLMAQMETDAAVAEAEARRRANGGLDLAPIFQNLAALMYRCTEIEKRIAELEARQKEEKLNG